jgi:hypothetical protein
MQPAHGDPTGGKGPGPAGSGSPVGEPPSGRPLSALPSVQARALAFAAIIIAGICGALIGWSFVDLQCHGDCTVPNGAGSVVGAIIAAAGVAVVAVLVLRAMGEWKTIKEDRALAEAAQAAIAATSRIDTGGEGALPPDGVRGEHPEESSGPGDGDDHQPGTG